jgi:hypothetical protein
MPGDPMALASTALVLTMTLSPAAGWEGAPSLIEGLSRRIDVAEDRFDEDLADLAALDVLAAAYELDRALRRIEQAAHELVASSLAPAQLRSLELGVLDQAEYARFRLREFETTAVGAGRLSDVLQRMRRARSQGRPELAIALHTDLIGEARLGETAPVLMRRLLAALREERTQAGAGLLEPLPRVHPR